MNIVRGLTGSLYIDGGFVAADSSETLDIVDPANGERLQTVANAGRTDVAQAVGAARRAFDRGPWGRSTAQERGRVLFNLAAAVRKRAPELAELEARNSGKPIVEAEYD